MNVLAIYDTSTLYAWLVGEPLESAGYHIATGYPSLLAGWQAGTVFAAVLDVPDDGSFSIFSATGQPLPGVITGTAVIPADCAAFMAVPVATGGVILSWAGVAADDLLEYVVRWSPLLAAASWYTSSVVWRTFSPVALIPAALPGTYLVKATTKAGAESMNAAAVVVPSVPSIMPLDTATAYDEAAAWGGTLDNFTETAGELVVTDPARTGTYTAANEVDFGVVKTARVTASLLWRVLGSGVAIDDITDIDAVAAWDGESGDSDVQAFIYTSQDGSAPTLKQPLFAGDYTFRRARFTLEATATNPARDARRAKLVSNTAPEGSEGDTGVIVRTSSILEEFPRAYDRIIITGFTVTVAEFTTIATL